MASVPHYKIPGYESWQGMNQRCNNKNQKAYKNYGGRGITICNRWAGEDGFLNFIEDMGERPTPQHTLDRINNDGNYEPSNCRWATRTEQNRNKRDNKLLTHNGVTKTASEWGIELGSDINLINSRLRYGWSVGDAVSEPPRKSETKGVYWDESKHRWVAYMTYNKKSVLRKAFTTKEAAVEARRNAEELYRQKTAKKAVIRRTD